MNSRRALNSTIIFYCFLAFSLVFRGFGVEFIIVFAAIYRLILRSGSSQADLKSI
jgi:hypothetical protein